MVNSAAVLAHGLAATVQRTNERIQTVIIIEHEPNVLPGDLLRVVKKAAFAGGMVKLGRGDVVIAGGAEDGGALAELEKRNALQKAEIDRLRDELRRKDAALDMQPVDKSEWINIREAAVLLGKSYPTIYRAMKDGRITARESKVNERSTWEVIASTYRPKPGKAKGKR
jgi:hypothetical protein